MQIIKQNGKYVIYGDAVKSLNKLPAKGHNYVIKYDKPPYGIGFYLAEEDSFKPTKSKIYGDFDKKTTQIVEAYKKSNKSIGVILSGDKGLGKTLFAKELAQKFQQENMPVILANKGYKGIGSFISNIKQDSMILFDEFEKNFTPDDNKGLDNETEDQSSMLSIFDGVSEQKHLYVITVNDIFNLSEYFLNRPGRFMYAIRLEYPDTKQIKEFLNDSLNDDAKDQINSIIKFSYRVLLNYDTLAAIVFQLNSGFKFTEIINDLNIMNIGTHMYSIKLIFDDGYEYVDGFVRADLFKNEVDINTMQFDVKFNSDSLNVNNEILTVNGKDVSLSSIGEELAKHVKHGLSTEPLKRVELKINRRTGFKFNNI